MRSALRVLVLLISAGSAVLLAHHPQTKPEQERTALSSEERERLLGIGKQLFLERCAKCHDERGDKPLKSGPPLSERKLSDEEIARLVSGRLKDAPDEQKRAVALYVSSFMKRKR